MALSIGPGGIGEPGLVEHRCQAEERDGRYYRGVPNDRSLVVGEAPFTLSEMGYGVDISSPAGKSWILLPFG